MRKFDVNSTGNSQYSNLLVGEVYVPDSCGVIVRQSLNRAKYEKKPYLYIFVTANAAAILLFAKNVILLVSNSVIPCLQ